MYICIYIEREDIYNLFLISQLCISLSLYIYLYIYIYIEIYVCVYIYIYIYIYRHWFWYMCRQISLLLIVNSVPFAERVPYRNRSAPSADFRTTAIPYCNRFVPLTALPTNNRIDSVLQPFRTFERSHIFIYIYICIMISLWAHPGLFKKCVQDAF